MKNTFLTFFFILSSVFIFQPLHAQDKEKKQSPAEITIVIPDSIKVVKIDDKKTISMKRTKKKKKRKLELILRKNQGKYLLPTYGEV